MELNAKQQEIFDKVVAFVNRGEPRSSFVLSGLAGTGKTTLVTQIIDHLYNVQGWRVALCAPTGKAASVLNSKQRIIKAQTVHGLFGAVPSEVSVEERLEYSRLSDRIVADQTLTPQEKARYSELKLKIDRAEKKLGFSGHRAEELNEAYDVIIIDEASMLGVKSHGENLGFDYVNIPIIFVGDPGQLPPVNDTPYVDWSKPDGHLDDIMRQGADSGIVPYAHVIYRGGWPNRAQIESMGTTDIALLPNLQPRTILAAEAGHQILCHRNDTRHQFNNLIRAKLGIKGVFEEHYPAVGELLLCKETSKPDKLFNGTLLRVTEVKPHKNWVDNKYLCIIDAKVEGEDREVKNLLICLTDMCESKQLHSSPEKDAAHRDVAKRNGILCTWTYALTVHSAQGSEWDKVLVVGELNVSRPQGRQWWYTAVTRARNELMVASLDIR